MDTMSSFTDACENFRHASLHIKLQQAQVCYCSGRPWTASVFPSFDTLLSLILLANVNSRSRSLYAIARPSVVCLSSVCRLSVTRVRPTQAVEIFCNIFLQHLVSWPSVDIHVKFYGDRPRGTPPPGELNTRGVVKYSDFGLIDGYISETVQDRRQVSINHL